MIILETRVAGITESMLESFLVRARRAAKFAGPVNVLVTSSARMRTLNREFRGKNQPTDVLSFPVAEESVPKPKRIAGEIAISSEIAAQNSARLGHPPAIEVKILILHGLLHLAGFDHERDNGEMAQLECRLRQQLRLPAALIERTQPPDGRRAHRIRGRRGRP